MATETLRPNAAGDETNIDDREPDTGEANYEDIDEADADNETTLVKTINETYLRDFYNLENHSVGGGTINFIKVYARAVTYWTPSIATLKIVIKSGTGDGAPDTPDESDEITVTEDWTTYSNTWATNPATGLPWTWDEIDQLQVGISLRRIASFKRTSCTQVYVVVDYTPTGWTGKISGVTNPAKVMGVDVANIKSVKGVVSA